MALQLLRLYNDGGSKRLYESDRSRSAVPVPDFISGDLLGIEYTLLTDNPTGGFTSPWTKVSPGSYTLKIALFTEAGTTLLALQNTWQASAAEGLYRGILALDAAAIGTALGSASQIPVVFEIEITDTEGNSTTTLHVAAVLKKGLIGAALLALPPGEYPASKAWCDATFLKKDNGDGDRVVLKFGSWGLEIGVSANGAVILNAIAL
jgi:hypothetical protein